MHERGKPQVDRCAGGDVDPAEGASGAPETLRWSVSAANGWSPGWYAAVHTTVLAVGVAKTGRAIWRVADG
jgi:hypothetical protein